MKVSKKTTQKLDTVALWELLDEVRQERGLSWRAVARENGGMYSHVFARMRTGQYDMSANVLVSLLLWAGHLSLEGLVVDMPENEGGEAL